MQKTSGTVWCLSTIQVNYPIIKFLNDSLIELHSTADTIYRYNYSIDKMYLVIHKASGELNRNKIEMINTDSLVFFSLLENNSRQSYFRCQQ